MAFYDEYQNFGHDSDRLWATMFTHATRARVHFSTTAERPGDRFYEPAPKPTPQRVYAERVGPLALTDGAVTGEVVGVSWEGVQRRVKDRLDVAAGILSVQHAPVLGRMEANPRQAVCTACETPSEWCVWPCPPALLVLKTLGLTLADIDVR